MIGMCALDPHPQNRIWLKETTPQHPRKGLSRTFVAAPHDEAAVAVYRKTRYADVGPLVVNATADRAARFHGAYGFQTCGTQPLKLFLAME